MNDIACQPATINDLKLLISLLNKNNVEYLLIGGYALFASGYERATTDIDILVPATIDSGEKVISALTGLPDGVARDIDPNWFVDVDSEDHGTIRVADKFLVDVMFNACGETYETLKPYMKSVFIDGIEVKTVTLQGLLLTKNTVREKDRADKLILERAISVMDTMDGNDLPSPTAAFASPPN